MVVFPYIGSENLGISYLSSFLNSKGHKTKLAFDASLFDDTMFLHLPSVPALLNNRERFASYIVSLKPKILAFSVFTMNYLWALDIAARVKSKMDVVTVFGGVHVHAVPLRVLSDPNVDYIIRGEGEHALLELVESLYSGKIDVSIRNLGYKGASGPVLNPIRPLIENLDDLPYADRGLFANYENYEEIMLYMCGRGCPFKCTFCSSYTTRSVFPNPGKFVRRQSVERCITEMKLLKDRYSPKAFSIVDDVFTINKEWMTEFCIRYKNEIGLPFQVLCYPTTLDEGKVMMLKSAGCYFFSVGVQSLNTDNRRNIIKRYESDEDIINCVKWAKKYDLGISLDYIFFPWEENEEDQVRAARFFHKHRPDRVANFYLSYLPGTAIVNYALEHKYIAAEDMEAIETGVNAHYHAGGEFAHRTSMRFFKQFYNLFLLLLILPEGWGDFLISKRLYRYTHVIPSTVLLIIKEILLPQFSKRHRYSLYLIRYAKYYIKNMPRFIMGKFD